MAPPPSEMSDEELGWESLEDVSDDCSDYEASLKTTKRRKSPVVAPKPPKRPRRKAASKVTSSPPKVSSRPAGSVNKRNEVISAVDLYNAVGLGKSAMVAVVDEWLDSYKQDREMGLLSLINFIVLSCGCKGVVSRQMLSSMQHAEIIGSLTKDFKEDSVSYPLSTPGPQFKRFKAGLCEFAQVLVRSCRNSFLYDEYLFHSLLALLTGLSDSQVRAFRHTSSLLAMKVMTGLVEVAVTLSVQLETTQHRCDRENRKSPHKRDSARLEELQPIINELKEKQEELCSMLNATFRGVFVHRYRDRIPDVRMVCMEELGTWLKTNPEYFLNDGCLKYLGWTLHDKQSPVRLQCVRALQGLYQEEEFIGRLELFTSRFKERILSMVLDKDPDVAVEVVNLLLLIQQKTEEGLTEAECGHIYPLVYSSHRGLSSAAGAFLYNKLKTLTSDNQEEGVHQPTVFFQLLIAFHVQSEFHEHGAYLVDSVWDAAGSELRDWETMTTMLLEDADLTDEGEGALIEIMMCAIRQAAQTTPLVGRSQGKKNLNVKDKKTQEQDRRRITTHFIPLLPQLLSKYSADAEKVRLLLKAPLHFNLEMYNSAQWLEKHLDLLLSQIRDIVQKHTEDSVLQACANLACALSSDNYKFSSRTSLALGQLSDGLTECFGMYLNDLLQGTADDDDMYSAAATLKRIAALSSAIDPTGWKLFDPCVELLKSRIDAGELDKELMVPALKCAAFHLMWAKVNAVNFRPAQAELTDLKKMVRSFCRVCQACLSVERAEIRAQAFELLCDLLLLYSTSSVRAHPALHSLAHLPSDSLRSEMAAFLLDHVFTEPEVDGTHNEEEEEELEMKMTTILRKRNQLAGYCKLIIYGVLDLSAATDVFKHYKKFFRDFGDIIKMFMSKSKLINPVQSAKTVCLSLQQLFTEMLTEGHSRRDLGEIRDLGKRLAMSFGIDLQRVRKPLVALHMDGIRFALRKPQDGGEQLPNVSFLEILSEFTFKLLPQDKSQMAALLKSECSSAAISWPSVRMYLQSLKGRLTVHRPREQQEAGEDAVSSHDPPMAKRKKTSARESASTSAKESWLNASSIHGNLPTPILTSTVQRQPVKPRASSKPAASDSDISPGMAELESEDEFSSGPQMRKVKPFKRRQLHSTMTVSDSEQLDLNSNLTMLSLIEDVDEEMEEAEIEDNESDFEDDSGYILPSTRQTSTSILDELFD